MPKPPLVVRCVAVVLWRDQVLLVTAKLRPEVWVPPGGKLGPRETAVAAAEREVQEEAGIRVAVGALLAYREVWWPEHDALELYFSAHPLEPSETTGATPEPGRKAAAWFAVDGLHQVPHFPADLGEICQAALAGQSGALHLTSLDLR